MGRKVKLELGYADQTQSVTIDVPLDEPKPWDASDQLALVGKGVPRIDGPLKVSGQARYTHDVALPDMLYAAVLRCPFPCAKLESLDLAAAEKHEGVHAVLALAKPGDRLLFAGQDVAAVAATRPELARAALDAIAAKYAVEPHVVDTREAMGERAPRVHQQAVEEGLDEVRRQRLLDLLHGAEARREIAAARACRAPSRRASPARPRAP